MKKLLLFTIIIILAFTAKAQDTSKVKVTLKETQKWLKEKIESNGGRQVPASYYKVDFPDSCKMIIKELDQSDNSTLNKFTIEFSGIDFEKSTKKINSLGTLIINLYGTVGLTNEYAKLNKELELRFNPTDGEDFYKRFIKALKHMKGLCGGITEEKF